MNVGDPITTKRRKQERESDMPIVVKICGKVKPQGAKGHYCKRASNGEGHRKK
jgi:hypothetical protein